jgi:hypothetical protein
MELCTDNGVVRAEVVRSLRFTAVPRLAGSGGFKKKTFHSQQHDPSSANKDSRARPALDLNVRADYGDISLSLPRCFRGPITISTGDDRIAFSPAFEECMSLLSDVPGFRVYFVGERPLKGKWGSECGGDADADEEDGESPGEPLDELSVGGKFTSVRINWEGEKELPEMRPSGWQGFCGGTTRFFTSGRVC